MPSDIGQSWRKPNETKIGTELLQITRRLMKTKKCDHKFKPVNNFGNFSMSQCRKCGAYDRTEEKMATLLETIQKTLDKNVGMPAVALEKAVREWIKQQDTPEVKEYKSTIKALELNVKEQDLQIAHLYARIERMKNED